MPYKIVARAKSVRGSCGFGHLVGDEVVFHGETVQGRVCISALYSFLPKVNVPLCNTPRDTLEPS